MSQSRLIGLLDCNSFFASCEKLFRPDLKDKAVVVLSNNDGVVVSRSSEAKKLVPMGEPHYKIKHIAERVGFSRMASRTCRRIAGSGRHKPAARKHALGSR